LRPNEAVPSALTPINEPANRSRCLPVSSQRGAPVAAGDQLELAEVGRDRHDSERRVGLSESTSERASRRPWPVLMIEYDCHQGIFLDNPQPEPFYVHTIVRTPNGGDYGRDLLRRHLLSHHAGGATR
jgi:hypothetical protein